MISDCFFELHPYDKFKNHLGKHTAPGTSIVSVWTATFMKHFKSLSNTTMLWKDFGHGLFRAILDAGYLELRALHAVSLTWGRNHQSRSIAGWIEAALKGGKSLMDLSGLCWLWVSPKDLNAARSNWTLYRLDMGFQMAFAHVPGLKCCIYLRTQLPLAISHLDSCRLL